MFLNFENEYRIIKYIGRTQEENTDFCNQKQVARFRDKSAKYEESVCMRNLSPL